MFVALLHLVYLKLCMPFRNRLELGAGARSCDGDTTCMNARPRQPQRRLPSPTHPQPLTPSPSPPPPHPLTPSPSPPPPHLARPAELLASACDLGVFVCGIVLIAKQQWTNGERHNMGIAMLALQATGFLVFITIRLLLAGRTLALTLAPLCVGVLPASLRRRVSRRG